MATELSHLMLYGGYSLLPSPLLAKRLFEDLPGAPLQARPLEGSIEEVPEGIFVHCFGNHTGMAGDVTVVVLDQGADRPSGPDLGQVAREHSFVIATTEDITVTTTDLEYVGQFTPPAERCQGSLWMVRGGDASRGHETHYFSFEPLTPIPPNYSGH